MKISGSTQVIGLLGYPLTHSLSPLMHNRAFQYLGLDYCYVAFPVKAKFLPSAVWAIRALSLKGVNVTAPHKEKIIPLLDEIDKEAGEIGAVNTVINRDDRLIGYNTDGRGFMKALKEEGISVDSKNILLIGSGGAARAIGYYLSKSAKGLYLYDIDHKKAKALKKQLQRKNIICLSSLKSASLMDIIINATPLGLKDGDPLPIDLNLIKPSQIIGDLIYKETPLLKKAKNKGCKTFNGLGMLLWQGVLAFELWTELRAPVEVMRKALIKKI